MTNSLAADYRVKPQVHAGDYRIDLVVEGENDARLAVELDGDKYHGIERWLEDTSRQRTLERMNWVFWRCWGSNYTCDKEGCLADLLNKLGSLKIEPIGYDGNGACGLVEQRIVKSDGAHTFYTDDEISLPDTKEKEQLLENCDSDKALVQPLPYALSVKTLSANGNGHQSESYVQINDTVTYAYVQKPDDLKMVQIVRGQALAAEGIISHSSPIAQTLLGAFKGEKVTAKLPTGEKEIIVFDIVKS